MITRSFVLAVNADTIPQVAKLLHLQNIRLGLVAVKEGNLRCTTITTPTQPAADKLTDRDLAILHAFADGLSYDAIGNRLGLAGGYVKSYSTKFLFRRLGARDRASAVAIAYRLGALNDWEAAA